MGSRRKQLKKNVFKKINMLEIYAEKNVEIALSLQCQSGLKKYIC